MFRRSLVRSHLLEPKSRRKGRALGNCLIGSGTVTGMMLASDIFQGAAWTLSSTAVVAPGAWAVFPIGACCYGTWLKNKLYMDDDEAKAEYREKFLGMKLSDALYGKDNFQGFFKGTALENVLKFVSVEDVQKAFNEQCGPSKSFTQTLSTFKPKQLMELLEHNCIDSKSIAERFEKEVNSKTFSEMWRDCGGSTLDYCTRKLPKEIVDATLLGKAFDAEYAWIEKPGGATELDGPCKTLSGETRPPSDNIWFSISSQGEFLMRTCRVSKEKLKKIVEGCSFATKSSTTVAQLRNATGVENTIISLFDKGLLSAEFIDRKLDRELKAKKASFGTTSLDSYDTEIDLLLLLSREIVSHRTVQPLFSAGIPTNFSDSLNSHCNIIVFIKKWKKMLEKYPDLVEDQYRQSLMIIWRTYDSQAKLIRKDFDRRCMIAANEEAEHRRFMERVEREDLNVRRNRTFRPSVSRIRQSDLQRDLDDLKRDCHADWVESVQGRRTGQGRRMDFSSRRGDDAGLHCTQQ